MRAILVTGSREWSDRQALETALWNEVIDDADETRLIVGDCPTGADAMAAGFWDSWVTTNLGDLGIVFKADWDTHGKAAGPIRNKAMVDHLINNHKIEDIVVLAFFSLDAANRGTRNCVAAALAAGIPDNQVKRIWR